MKRLCTVSISTHWEILQDSEHVVFWHAKIEQKMSENPSPCIN